MKYDVCIIGSGPAGLTLCAELADAGLKVCVLESGHAKKTAHADALREVKSTGDIQIKQNSRERILGGTSTTWSGLSAPLDPIDFTRWPISLGDLKPYYEKAHMYGFPKLNEFLPEKIAEAKKASDITPKFLSLEEKIFIANDPPWNFGKELQHLFKNPNVDLILDATVTSMIKNDGSIESVTVRSSEGTEKIVAAQVFVCAAGGIENTRLLLAGNIGNENGQVGKYLTNHPKGNFGIIRLNKKIKKLPYLFGYLENGQSTYAGFRFPDQVQKDRGLLNSYVRFEPLFPWTDNRGVESLIILVKKAQYFLQWWKKRQKGIVNLRDWNETGDDKTAFAESASIPKLILRILLNPYSVFLYSYHRILPNNEIAIKNIRIRNFMDMEPRAENRMILTDKKDTNGIRIPEIHITLSERDQRSLIELHKTLGKELESLSLGRLESDFSKARLWPLLLDASHHLGGTCMGNDLKTSVVDKNLKVHSISNLYIVGGSVFPSSGCANPTYTICALAIRLADELKTLYAKNK